MREIIVEVSNVSKQIKQKIIFDQISFNLEKGKALGLIGRNGSGKSMLFKSICGFVTIDSGELKVNGKRVGEDGSFPKNIGFLIEYPGFLPNYTGYENLKILASIQNKITDKEIKDVLNIVGLDWNDNRTVKKYSLGMKQRLGIAQAIMEKPELLILDEPMNGLDKQGVEDIRKLILSLKKNGTTILLASHNAEDIEILCDNVIEIDQGRIIS